MVHRLGRPPTSTTSATSSMISSMGSTLLPIRSTTTKYSGDVLCAIFDRHFEVAKSSDDYFVQRRDCNGDFGLSVFQKVTAAICIMAKGTTAEAVDRKIGLSESITLQCLVQFCDIVIDTFRADYLRSPIDADVMLLLIASEKRGFLGMIGSIDCSK